MRQKSRQKKPTIQRNYSLEELHARPVTHKDTWCHKPTFLNGEPVSEEQWGLVLTLPFVSRKRQTILPVLEGYCIIRSKKMNGRFLLQVVKTTTDRKYGISSQERELFPPWFPNRAKKKRKKNIWNIRNYQKK